MLSEKQHLITLKTSMDKGMHDDKLFS